jgi:myo-inositol-1(or 4)-monophosphatase
MTDYKSLCLAAAEISRETGLFIRHEREKIGIQVESKGKNDFVTQFDKAAERKLIDVLERILPESGFIAEESTSTKRGKRFNWIIDPIDGTTNFIHGLFPYAISVGLMEDDRMVAGVVYEAGLDECFYAWEGAPAMLNDKEIQVSKRPTVADSLIATGFPYTNFSLMPQFMESLDFFMKNSHGMRRLGSAAADLVYLACGRFEAFYEYDLKPWDVAAGALIVQQAGGKVTDFSGGNHYIFGREIMASNALIYDEFSAHVKHFLTPGNPKSI